MFDCCLGFVAWGLIIFADSISYIVYRIVWLKILWGYKVQHPIYILILALYRPGYSNSLRISRIWRDAGSLTN